MKTGASTSCLFPMLTEQSLDRLLALGVKNIEVFFNSPSECDKQFVREMKAAADAAGAKIISSHPYTSEMEGVCFALMTKPRRMGDILKPAVSLAATYSCCTVREAL